MEEVKMNDTVEKVDALNDIANAIDELKSAEAWVQGALGCVKVHSTNPGAMYRKADNTTDAPFDVVMLAEDKFQFQLNL